jgi:hypothetical protein
MSDRRDAGGSLVTDYSRSPIAPERARKLNAAELDYVNGYADEETGELAWPSYPELAEKHGLPVRVIQEQAAKHRWVSRREQRKSAMIAFRNEQTRKQWLDMDREVMGVMQQNMHTAAFIANRLMDEYRRLAMKAIAEENARIAAGELDAVVRVPVRAGEVESTMRTCENIVKTAERLAGRIAGLPTLLPEIAPPVLIQTVEQEEAERAEEAEAVLPKATILDVVRELRAIEEARSKLPGVVYGEVDYDDDEDDDGAAGVEMIGVS